MSHGYAGYGAQYSRKTVKLGDVSIPYLEGGYGEPLLYLHGLGGWGQWERHLYSLAVSTTVYAPQLPGWRDGEIPESLTSVRDYAGLMAQFLAAVNVPKAVVVGHSLGGWIALWLAVDHPELVSRLIIADAMGIDVPEAPAANLEEMDEDAFASAAFAKSDEVLITADFGTLVENVRTGPEFEKHWKGREVAIKLLDGKYSDPELTRRLNEIQAETLIIWGDADNLTPKRHGEVLLRALPSASLAVMHDSSHIPMRMKPETFNRLTHNFLTGANDDLDTIEADLVTASA